MFLRLTLLMFKREISLTRVNFSSSNVQIPINLVTRYLQTQTPKEAYNHPTPNYRLLPRSYDDLCTVRIISRICPSK